MREYFDAAGHPQLTPAPFAHSIATASACEKATASSPSSGLPSSDSLIAAIEGNDSGMSKEDLILTCQMLRRGRASWRKEAETAHRALRLAINTVECASVDKDGNELPWYRAAQACLNEVIPNAAHDPTAERTK